MNLDESGLQSVYETQAIDPDTEEIDRALIQLGLVGHTPVVSSGPSKWITVKEEGKWKMEHLLIFRIF